MAEAPYYVLVFYNGDNTFIPAGVVYERGVFTGYLSGGLPRTFSVEGFSVTPDGYGGRTITLDSSGCLAVARCKGKQVAAAEGTEIMRYAAATAKRMYFSVRAI